MVAIKITRCKLQRTKARQSYLVLSMRNRISTPDFANSFDPLLHGRVLVLMIKLMLYFFVY